MDGTFICGMYVVRVSVQCLFWVCVSVCTRLEMCMCARGHKYNKFPSAFCRRTTQNQTHTHDGRTSTDIRSVIYIYFNPKATATHRVYVREFGSHHVQTSVAPLGGGGGGGRRGGLRLVGDAVRTRKGKAAELTGKRTRATHCGRST